MLEPKVQTRTSSYQCTTGHEIAPRDLERLTEEVAIDAGAVVRICREHGAPIALTVEPPSPSA